MKNKLWSYFIRQASSPHHQFGFLDSFLMVRRLSQPPMSGCEKVEAKLSDFLGTKLVGNGNDWLVLPRTLKFICSKLVFTKIHHKVAKNVFIVRSWLTYSFRGKSYQASWQGFVSEQNWISFSLKIGILVSQLTYSFRRISWQASWQGNTNANFQREWNPILLQNNSLSIWLSWFPPKWVSESAPLTLKMFLDTLWWSFVNTSCYRQVSIYNIHGRANPSRNVSSNQFSVRRGTSKILHPFQRGCDSSLSICRTQLNQNKYWCGNAV